MKVTFTDAQEMHKKHPNTFDAPSWSDLNLIEPGDFVKICGECKDGGERFWLKVTKVTPRKITGEVDNDLVTLPYKLGETLTFEPKHVYDIMKG